jgi:4-hydroxythreonine-4-phosphate dehydrogenase
MKKVRVALTMGDPSGIGPQVCAGALARLGAQAEFVVVGDRGVWERVTASQRHRVTGSRFVDLHNVDPKRFRFGQIKAEYGKASIEYLDAAMQLLKKKQVDCLVTAPICKESVSRAGYRYAGHTEYLASKTGRKPVMLLANERIRFALVTRHIPLAAVPRALSRAKIEHAIAVTHESLRRFFGVARPRLMVCGINPHGSDNGVIGSEELRRIKPVVDALRRRFPGISGPFGADVAIARALRERFDCVIAMYHDQALIPLKVLGDASGVNMTLGLGFVRTSPLHGTAFDIAGTSQVDPASLITAASLAIRCCQNQRKA